MHLHVVSFDLPFPPNYGGVIDVYQKLRALQQNGQAVHLHCFTYGRKASPELEKICERVYYYPRLPFFRSIPFFRPYIVSSRRNPDLLLRLQADNAPILFEGLHCTALLPHPALAHRTKLLRMHNVEWQYYHQLAQRESHAIKKLYLSLESALLKRWEAQIIHATHILAISPSDTAYFQSQHPHVAYLPAFHGNARMVNQPGNGPFAIYHGNLAVAENHQAASFLIEKVFRGSTIPLTIAGGNPRPELIAMAQSQPNVSVIANPSQAEMNRLLHTAQVHVLPTFQNTGIKLKLLNSLFTGRFVLTNSTMVTHTGLEKAVTIAESPEEWRLQLNKLFHRPFTQEDQESRQKILFPTFDDRANAQKIITLLTK